MHKRIITRQIRIFVASLATLVLSVLFLFLLARSIWLSPSNDLTQYGISLPLSTAEALATNALNVYASPPIRLVVPSLDIDASVQHVGVSKSGRMAVPTNYNDVGWYKPGTIPGNIGAAVFDGHVDDGLGLPGVFKYLGNISIGDEIQVISEDGTILVFIVEALDVYDYNDAPTDHIFNQNDKARIRLITCQGRWVKGDQTYSQRLVVTGVLK